MKVSVRKISEITGFSPATVSNALNYKKGVNVETSAKIFKVAQDLGYFEENHIRKIKFVMFKRDGAVVRGGYEIEEKVRSSNPTIDMSSGIRIPNSAIAFIAPSAIISLSAKKAVGSFTFSDKNRFIFS